MPSKRNGNGDGSISRLADGTYRGSIRLGGKRPYFRGSTKAAVQRQIRTARAAFEQGLPLADNRITVSRFLADWLAAATLDAERSPNTLVGYRTNVRHITRHVGHVRLVDLSPQIIQTLRRRLHADGLSANSVKYINATLRVALGDAVEDGRIPRNPASVARRKGRKRERQEKRVQVQPLQPDQARRLLDATRGERLEALFSVALSLGLRRGEILGLRWLDVDFEQRRMHVRQQLQRYTGLGLCAVPVKTASGERSIDLPDPVVAALRTHRERQSFERRAAANLWRDSGLVFTDIFGGGIESTTLFRIKKRIFTAAGLDSVRFHDLRHTAASLLLAQGCELWEVSKILGHASYQFTVDTYGHLFHDARRAAADRMGSWLTAAGMGA